jgi:Ser/Thr protein kinase RdoA (MazF antagonist)
MQKRFAAAAGSDRLEWLGTVAEGLPLYLRAVDPCTGRPLRFLRVIDASVGAEAENWVAISRHLAAAGVATPELLNRQLLNNEVLVLSYRWMEGKYPLLPNLDFSKLGRSVAVLHNGLASLDSPSMKVVTRRRLDRLLLRSDNCSDATPPPARTMLRRFPNLCEIMLTNAGPTHGDLNPANVLVGNDGIGFLDFEDVHHMRVWPGSDLAKLLERLVVTRISVFGAPWAEAAAKSLIEGYRGCLSLSMPKMPLGEALLEAMRWHLALSLLVLWEAGSDTDPFFGREQEKLFVMANLVERGAPLVRRIV